MSDITERLAKALDDMLFEYGEDAHTVLHKRSQAVIAAYRTSRSASEMTSRTGNNHEETEK